MSKSKKITSSPLSSPALGGLDKRIIFIVVGVIIFLGICYWVWHKREVQLYYYNQLRDQEIAEYIPCSPEAVLPLKREIAVTKTLIRDTIDLLLKGGLTEEEERTGFQTEFPLEGLKLVSDNLKNGVLILEFDDPLSKTSGGSCRVRLLWAQIEKTAKQFPEVKEVKFIPEWLFQP